MKKLLAVILFVFSFFEIVYAATKQPQPIGNAVLPSFTVAQLAALTGNTTGQVAFCSNCATNGGAGTICISTGAFANSFVLSTGTVCK